MADPKIQYRYHNVRPTQAIGGETPTGNIEFETVTPSESMTNLVDSYVGAVVVLTKAADWDFSAGAADTSLIAQNDGICQNVFAQFFKHAIFRINDKIVSQNTEYSHASTQMKLAMNNMDEELDGMSPLVPYDYYWHNYDTDAQAADHNVINQNFANGKVIVVGAEQRLANAKRVSLRERVARACPTWNATRAKSNATTPTVLVLHLALPLAPLFMQHQNKALPRSKLQLDLNFDSNYITNVVVSQGALATIEFKELYWNLPMYEAVSGPPRNLTFESTFTDTVTHKNTYEPSQQYPVTNGSAKTVLISFVKKLVGPETDRNQLSGCFNLADGAYLSTLYLQYAGRTYPAVHYRFGTPAVAGNAGGQTVTGEATMLHIHRAYADYKAFTDANSRSVGSVLTFRQYMESPVFVFSVDPPISDTSKHINIESTGLNNTYDMIVTVLKDAQLRIEYDDNGIPSSTNVSYIN